MQNSADGADSESDKNSTEQNQTGILLSKAGIKKVITAFEAKMNSQILYLPTGQKLSYTAIIFRQVQHYKRVINEEETEYKAYYFK